VDEHLDGAKQRTCEMEWCMGSGGSLNGSDKYL